MTTKLFDNPIDISVNDLMLDCKNIRFGHLGTSLTEAQIEEHSAALSSFFLPVKVEDF